MTLVAYREKSLLQSIAKRNHGNVVHITGQREKIKDNVTSLWDSQATVVGYDHNIQRQY